MTSQMVTCDANETVADVAYRVSEFVAIYPITPASPMGEHADAWAAAGRPNLWGDVPTVVEMQSEGGAAGAVHGALQAGSLSTTFTASQGLLLMIPNMYKIAGELTPMVVHVAARTVATHALSIFGDHSDVYAARGTGFAMLVSNSVQEAHDFALIAHAATLLTRVPFLHFFDGFRTSHEVAKTERLADDDIVSLLDMDTIAAHRARALTPDRPVLRGTAQNPDAFFQAREAVNTYYDATVGTVQRTMDEFSARTGRHYAVVEYVGAKDATRVLVVMGSGAETAHETVDHLVQRDERVGLVKIRLYRPFPAEEFTKILPRTCRAIAVLDRAKEPGAVGEPLYLDVTAAIVRARHSGRVPAEFDPIVVGGRFGLSGKEFQPAMVAGVFEELARPTPRHGFTVGIVDDVTHLSIPFDETLDIEAADVTRAVFYGLGSDGTVGANKNTIKIIGERTDLFAQGYFVYDSKKAGAMTISHLRFGPRPIRSTYLIRSASFVACHHWSFLERVDMLDVAAVGATFLLNSPHAPSATWGALPKEVQQTIIQKQLKLYVVDANRVATEAGLNRRINTIMQMCFFSLSGVLAPAAAIDAVKDSIQASYGMRGETIVAQNSAAVDSALAHLHAVQPGALNGTPRPPPVPFSAPAFVQRVTAMLTSGQGDRLPVSAFPPDGTWPTATSQWEKRNIALEIPVWDPSICIQCNKCILVCPHAAIRAKVYPAPTDAVAPIGFQAVPYKEAALKGQSYTIQVAPEDCTGCTQCVQVCPAKDKSNPRHKSLEMAPQAPIRDAEAARFAYFLTLPEVDRTLLSPNVKHSQLLRPLFEFSGACSGCGETPYIKLLTQLFGDRLLIANATGCSSIFGGNLPTTPYATDQHGRGPAWSNSLFEDNAEFGLGMRLAIDHQRSQARRLLERLRGRLDSELVDGLIHDPQRSEAEISIARGRVANLRERLEGSVGPDERRLLTIVDQLVEKAVWLVGGDGWAYDIGYGGLDHALASGQNINVLVLDTEVYSNTGGQQSKATPKAAVAKFASAGKSGPKKDLAMLAMAYPDVYVARVAFGANDKQTVTAFVEAALHTGPSLILAYSHCIAHGYDLAQGLRQQKLAVETGYWPLLRRNPNSSDRGASELKLDSRAPERPLEDFAYNEARFRLLKRSDPARAKWLLDAAQEELTERYRSYQALAAAGDSKPPGE